MNSLEFISTLVGPDGEKLIRLKDAARCCAQHHAEAYGLVTGLAQEILDTLVSTAKFQEDLFALVGPEQFTAIGRAALSSGRYLNAGLGRPVAFIEITPYDPPDWLFHEAKQIYGWATNIASIAQAYHAPDELPQPQAEPFPVGGQVATAKKVQRCLEGRCLPQNSKRRWVTIKKGGQTLKYSYTRDLE